MDLQEKQRKKREEQLAADNEKRSQKRAAMQAPSSTVEPIETPKVSVETTRYTPTIPDYATKIEFGEQQRHTPIAAYNRFKVLSQAPIDPPKPPEQVESLPSNEEEGL